MDEFDVLDELETNIARKRSTFLTVLCILTWVGSGGAILYYGYQFMMLSAMTEVTKGVSSPGMNDPFDKLQNYMAWWTIILMIKAIAPIFTIIGAVFMWMLRKWGFYIYLFGQLVPVGFGIWFSLTLGDDFRGFTLILTAVSSIIPLGFVVMYAVNLKDMR